MISLEVKDATGIRTPGSNGLAEADQRPGAAYRTGHGIQRIRAGAVSVLQRRTTDPKGAVLGPNRICNVAKEVRETSVSLATNCGAGEV